MISNEHKQADLFTHGEIPDLNMPDGYKALDHDVVRHLTIDAGQTRP
jgi:hypothetical protein